LTIATWMKRLHDRGAAVLVRPRVAVNRYPEFFTELVAQFKRLAPRLGTRKVADILD
jgi:hypothetical protein